MVVLIFILVFGFITYKSVNQVLFGYSSQKWTSTEGKIVFANITLDNAVMKSGSQRKSKTVYQVNILYSYKPDQEYLGKNIRLLFFAF